MLTMAQVKARNKEVGQHWFSPNAMRFFNSRVGKVVYGDKYFISSEKYDDGTARLYTIREVLADGSIDTVGEFQAYKSSVAAATAIKKRLDRNA